MSTLIFGAGYVGAALISAHVRDGDRVVAFDNGFATDLGVLDDAELPDFTLVRGDLRERSSVEAAVRQAWPIDRVYLLAAQASASPAAAPAEYTEETNLRGPRHVLEALATVASDHRTSPPPVIFGSSFHVYGGDLVGSVDERHPYGAQGDLSHLSKIYVERLGEMHARRDGTPFVPVRLGIVFGLGPVVRRDLRFVTVPHAFAIRRVDRLPITITPTGTRPAAYCHLTDAITALRLAPIGIGPGDFAPANVATEVMTAHDVLRAIDQGARSLGIDIPDAGPTPPAPDHFRVHSRLHDVGWRPTQTLATTAVDLIRHYQRTAVAPSALDPS